MAIGIVGKKVGMTRVFTEEGVSVPVTVIAAAPNFITQRKTVETDGYDAIQVAAGAVKPSKVSKPLAGHFKKANVEAGNRLVEFRVSGEEELNVGDALSLESFEPGQRVDVIGRSKGKGFAGVVKRHNFHTQDMSHGNSVSHRAPGSIGQCQTPGRVFKGKKMAGQMGNARVTAQTLEIVRVDQENNLILVKGPVPGAKGGEVVIRPATRARD